MRAAPFQRDYASFLQRPHSRVWLYSAARRSCARPAPSRPLQSSASFFRVRCSHTALSLRLGCHFARFRHTHRSLPFACERFAGSATQPDYCETRPLGVRVAGQERLSGLPVRLPGTALRYGS